MNKDEMLQDLKNTIEELKQTAKHYDELGDKYLENLQGQQATNDFLSVYLQDQKNVLSDEDRALYSQTLLDGIKSVKTMKEAANEEYDNAEKMQMQAEILEDLLNKWEGGGEDENSY